VLATGRTRDPPREGGGRAGASAPSTKRCPGCAASSAPSRGARDRYGTGPSCDLKSTVRLRLGACIHAMCCKWCLESGNSRPTAGMYRPLVSRGVARAPGREASAGRVPSRVVLQHSQGDSRHPMAPHASGSVLDTAFVRIYSTKYTIFLRWERAERNGKGSGVIDRRMPLVGVVALPIEVGGEASPARREYVASGADHSGFTA